ncbi:MAG: SpoIIE family protein phosphatase, partial [Deltaproteobacteria bacterium]|nr:SpoIIE family protein phosphatase [Deltaproteobacteria bacterium]
YLDIHHKVDNHTWAVPLTGGHHVVGRSPEAQIVLAGDSVSRMHAEFVCGPHGRWWIHDLGSTNGTRLNGRRVNARLLSAGDAVQLGDYVLRLRVPSSAGVQPSTIPPPPEDEAPSTVHRRLTPAPSSRPPHLTASHLSSVMTFGRDLMRLEEETGRLSALCQFIVGPDFPGESVAIVRLARSASPRIIVGPMRHDGETALTDLNSSVLEKLWSTREPVRSAGTHEAGTDTSPSTLACLLTSDEEQLVVVYAELPGSHNSEEWLTLLAMLAEAYQQADLIWEMRTTVRASAVIEHELEMARQIQEGLVPTSLRPPGLDVAIGFEPCQWIGGDYVDAVPMPDGRTLLAVADACGKGLQAALVASSLHTLVHMAVDAGVDLRELMERINRHFCRFLPPHSFVTMVCVVIDPRTGDIECVSAGHPPAFVVNGAGELRQLQSETNIALGIDPTTMHVEYDRLAGDELLLLYTDGLTELVNERGSTLGVDALGTTFSEIVTTIPGAGVRSMQERLAEALNVYRASQMTADDTTFLIARRTSKY